MASAFRLLENRWVNCPLANLLETSLTSVSQVRLLQGNLDIAWIAVEAGGLDYVPLGKPLKLPPMVPGLEVLVVGSPVDLAFGGTHTFGQISAVRSMSDSLGTNVDCIQTDAAINHGNSGGPLFVKVDDRYLWAGVAVAKVDSADNLGMAILAEAFLDRDPPTWFAADPSGAVSLFSAWK